MEVSLNRFVGIILALLLAGPAMAAPPQVVPTVQALTAGNFTSYGTVNVNGYYAAGDGGGGSFLWTLGACTPDGGAYLASTGVSSAVGCWVRQVVNNTITPEMWGARPGTMNDATPAITAALAYMEDHRQYCLQFSPPPNKYYISDEILLKDNFCLLGPARLTGTNANQAYFRVSGSNAKLHDFYVDNTALVPGQTCLKMAPINEAITNTRLISNNNDIKNLYCFSTDEGVYWLVGPSSMSGDSLTYFNNLTNVTCQDTIRCMWWKDNTNANAGAGANENYIENLTVFSSSTRLNTAIQCDQCQTEIFMGGSIHGVTNGTSPNATPTAIIIDEADSKAGANSYNKIVGMRMEQNTLDCSISNTLTIGYGLVWVDGGCTFPNGVPVIWESAVPSADGMPFSIPCFTVNNSPTPITGIDTGAASINCSRGIQATAGPFYSVTENSEGLVNGGTFTITIPRVGPTFLLSISSNANYTAPGLFLVGSDGSTNVGALTAVKAGGGVTATQNGDVVTLTNVSGLTANFSASLTQVNH